MSVENSFLSFVAQERGRYRRRMYAACVVGVLIAVVSFNTQWANLQVGLFVLMFGQAVDGVALVLKIVQLRNDLTPSAGWFEREELFVKRLALFDAVCQTIGFLALGYAFWMYTRSLWISVAFGVVYPLAACFGITRSRSKRAIKQLRAKRREMLIEG